MTLTGSGYNVHDDNEWIHHLVYSQGSNGHSTVADYQMRLSVEPTL